MSNKAPKTRITIEIRRETHKESVFLIKMFFNNDVLLCNALRPVENVLLCN